MFCRMCGEQIPDNSETCPVCGEKQHVTMTGAAEKSEGTDKTPVKILKGTGKAIVTVGGPILIAALRLPLWQAKKSEKLCKRS